MSPPPPSSAPDPSPPTRRSAPPGGQVRRRSAPKLIGVAVDGSASASDAVALGSLLAHAGGAELMLIGIHEEPIVPLVLPGASSWNALETRTRTTLTEARDSLAPDARVAVQADVLVWRGLRHVVRSEHRDLLVVGSAHDAEAGRVRLGRTAGELLGHLECPLAIAPSGFRQNGKQRLDRIGVGFDDTPESHVALDLAASIAAHAGAALEVRGVIDDRVAGGLRTDQITLEGDALTDRQLISAFERDRAAVSSTGVATNLEVAVGMPTDVLSEMCGDVDLLVLGSGHSGPRGRVQPGSTGRGMLGLATCPLLLVPRPGA